MAELLSKEDLDSLYHNKGALAVVWCSWRCALRMSSLLGEPESLDVIWPQDKVKSVFLVLRSLFLLSDWDNLTKEKALLFARASSELSRTQITIRSSLGGAALAPQLVANATARAAAALSDNAGFLIPSPADGKNTYIDVPIITFSPSSNNINHASKNNFNADKFDFDLISREIEIEIDKNFWLSIALWPTAESPSNSEGEYLQSQSKLLNELIRADLSFLAEDLKRLWEMQPLGKHAKNYLKDISEADQNNPEALRRIILGNEADQIHAVRTLLLGPGGAGKSSLADCLQGKPVEKIKTATQGIEYQNHQPLDLQKTFPQSNPEEKDLSLYLWDFGGQTIFHGLHRAFLHENCVYILVVDSRHEQAPDEWLHQIRHLAGGNATVLLVTNQHDGCDIRQNETRLRREFPDLLDNSSFHYFSCIDSETGELTIFVNELTKAALGSQRTVWKETLNIHQAIREYTEQTSAVFIEMSQIKRIISDNGKVEDSKAMINSLEQLGFLASITEGSLSYCLKPEWAVDRAYELLYSDTLRDNKGKLDLFDFDECFAAAPTAEQQNKLLSFLNHRSLCFKLPESGEYFFPDAATADEPETVADLLKQEKRLQIRFDLPYLPLGFHTRLVKPLFNQQAGIKNSQHIWRQGFITQLADSYAVVQYLLRKSSIEITLIGNPEHYATLLDKFYAALSSALAESKTRLQPFTIRPFVFLEKGYSSWTEQKNHKPFQCILSLSWSTYYKPPMAI